MSDSDPNESAIGWKRAIIFFLIAAAFLIAEITYAHFAVFHNIRIFNMFF